MPKYMILHNAPQTAREIMAKSTPEEMKASMEEWVNWKNEAEKTVKFEWGLPLQAVSRVTLAGVAESDNQATGYSIMEADSKEAILAAVKNHPHLKTPGASIDILEMIPMPGM